VSHALFRVTDFTRVADFVLQVRFDDGTTQVIDFRPVLHGKLWGPLQDLRLFDQVTIDPIAHTLVWPNGADFDPETLRNWPKYKDALTEQARRWAAVTN
jgi:hypothetical protein